VFGVHIEFTVLRSRPYTQHVLHAVTARQRAATHLLGGIMVAGGILLAAVNTAAPIPGLGLALIGVAFGVQPFTWARRFTARMSDRMFGPHTYLLTDEAYQVSIPTMLGRYDWSMFDTVLETQLAFILFGEGRQVRVDVPKRALSPEQLDELRAFLAGRGLRPAGEARSGTMSG
jgi:hypothetical protein